MLKCYIGTLQDILAIIQIIQAQYDLLHLIGILRKKRRKYPSDSRYGSVETCRKASGILLSGRKNAREMVGAFRVKYYGKLNPEEHQEDLPPQRRHQEGQEEQEEGRSAREEG